MSSSTRSVCCTSSLSGWNVADKTYGRAIDNVVASSAWACALRLNDDMPNFLTRNCDAVSLAAVFRIGVLCMDVVRISIGTHVESMRAFRWYSECGARERGRCHEARATYHPMRAGHSCRAVLWRPSDTAPGHQTRSVSLSASGACSRGVRRRSFLNGALVSASIQERGRGRSCTVEAMCEFLCFFQLVDDVLEIQRRVALHFALVHPTASSREGMVCHAIGGVAWSLDHCSSKT